MSGIGCQVPRIHIGYLTFFFAAWRPGVNFDTGKNISRKSAKPRSHQTHVIEVCNDFEIC